MAPENHHHMKRARYARSSLSFAKLPRVIRQTARALGPIPPADAMDFLSESGDPKSSRQAIQSTQAKRERFYQGIIWLLVIWNLCLQARSLACGATPSSSLAAASQAAAASADASLGLVGTPMKISPTGSFDNPAGTSIETYGSAGVVCSGCTDAGTVTDGNATSASAITNASSSSANLPADGAPAAGSSSSSNDAVQSVPSPFEAAAVTAVAVAAEKLAATPTKGKRHGPPPSPPIPFGLPAGAACTSSFKGDSKEAQCMPFCIGKFARSHCARCKCNSCSFCPRDPTAKPQPAVVPTAAAMAPAAAAAAAAADVALLQPSAAAAAAALPTLAAEPVASSNASLVPEPTIAAASAVPLPVAAPTVTTEMTATSG